MQIKLLLFQIRLNQIKMSMNCQNIQLNNHLILAKQEKIQLNLDQRDIVKHYRIHQEKMKNQLKQKKV